MPRGRAYRFVETPVGENPTSRHFQRTVRSHAASVSHPGQITRRQARIRTLNEGEGIITFDTGPVNPTEQRDPRVPPTPTHTGELTTASGSGQLGFNRQPLGPNTAWNPYRLCIDSLSGNTFSPLQNLTTYHKPYLPGIVNHYIYNLTIPIPELDGSSAEPLFRAAWLPVVFHDPVIFQVVVLFAATHYATFADSSQFKSLQLELLSLKQLALAALIQRVREEQSTPSGSTSQARNPRETLIAAAAKMASYEAIFGAGTAFHLHMSTVTRLLRQQGGLATLGMNGFLARLLSFIDTNSAFLLGTNLYLVEFGLLNSMPLHQPFQPARPDDVAPQTALPLRNTNVVNLESFIGLANANANANASDEDPSHS